MKTELELIVGGLRVFAIERFSDVTLDDYAVGDARLVVLASPDQLSDLALGHYCFEKTLGRRGLLASIRSDDLPGLALDVAPTAHWVGARLQQGLRVEVACLSPLSVPLTAAALLLGSGLKPAEAVDRVRAVRPDTLMTPDEEITISRAQEHLLVHQDLQRRRAALRAAGRSPWEAQ